MNATVAGGRDFVAGLLSEMHRIFAELGEQGALEAESQGRVEIPTLLELAMRSEIEAAELAGFWMPSTPELDVKQVFAVQCFDEMKHYRLIAERLGELGHPVGEQPLAGGYSPLYDYLKTLRTTVERVAAAPFAREAIAEVRNAQFIALCERLGDTTTAALYREVIQPDEVHHHHAGRKLLEKYCADTESQRLAAAATRATLAIADELSTLAEKRLGVHPIPAS
jgi:1,2-phenylacetyl-CoA epoxidase catalytic subunit